MTQHTEAEQKKNDRKNSKNSGKSVKPIGGRVRRTRRRATPAVRKTN